MAKASDKTQSANTANAFITAASTTEDALRVITTMADRILVDLKSGTLPKSDSGVTNISSTLEAINKEALAATGITEEQFVQMHTHTYTGITGAVAQAAAYQALSQIEDAKGIPDGGVDVGLEGTMSGIKVTASARIGENSGYVSGATVSPVDPHATAHNNKLREYVLAVTAPYMKKNG